MKLVSEIAEELNALAPSLAPDLLPNGQRSGLYWLASGIADTRGGTSLYVNLAGASIGHWRDMGNAGPGEDRGDMLDLLRLTRGLADTGAAVAEAKRILGIADEWTPEARRADPAELERRAAEARARAEARDAQLAIDRELKARQAKRLWLRGVPIAGTPAEFYLCARELSRGDCEWPGALRYHPDVWCTDVSVKVPAMLASVMRADGSHIGTHRTYLDFDSRNGWCKLDVANPKKILGTFWGGFIPIHKGASGKSMRELPEGEPVYVTEGIEDAICVRMMRPEARIISAISLGNIGAILLPEKARRLVIVADRDENEKAQAQLERSIAQQQARGMDVALVMPPGEVGGHRVKDLNDWVRALNAQARRAKRGSAAA